MLEGKILAVVNNRVMYYLPSFNEWIYNKMPVPVKATYNGFIFVIYPIHNVVNAIVAGGYFKEGSIYNEVIFNEKNNPYNFIKNNTGNRDKQMWDEFLYAVLREVRCNDSCG